MKSLVFLPVIMLLAFSCSAQKKITAKDAVKYSGQNVMVVDKVYSTGTDNASNNTLLYLGSATNDYLTVLVKGSDNSKCSKWHPEKDFKGRAVCVTGTITAYKGKPAMYVTTASQLKLDLSDTSQPPV